MIATAMIAAAFDPPRCTPTTYCPSDCAAAGYAPSAQPIQSATVSLQGSSVGETQFQAAAARAVAVARTFPGVTRDLLDGLHLSLVYECCYTSAELAQIGRLGAALVWAPIAVRFKRVACVGGAYLVLTDPASQGALMGLAAALEDAMQTAGMRVHRFRAEEAPFHSSLFDQNSSYPTAEAVVAINKAMGSGWWNEEPITVTSFKLQGTNFTWHASETNVL